MQDRERDALVPSEGAREWARDGLVRGLRRTLRSPGDVVLAARIGLFLLTFPPRLARQPLDAALASIASARRPPAPDPDRGAERIGRLRQAWLMMPLLRTRNTCYVRAITLFRFLAPCGGTLRIHFGVEPGVDPGDRLRGHAWVTIDDRILEAPEPVLAGRVRELYTFAADA